jgi:hypothetical protein
MLIVFGKWQAFCEARGFVDSCFKKWHLSRVNLEIGSVTGDRKASNELPPPTYFQMLMKNCGKFHPLQ